MPVLWYYNINTHKGGAIFVSECECLEGCVFFNDKMAEMPATAQIMKEMYCLKDNTTCARYIVFQKLGRERVPADLFPRQVDRANQIILNG